MDADLQAQVTFHLTGKRQAPQLDAIEGRALRPALFAGYRDLTRLRYDFPLVLVNNPQDAAFARPLSALIDAILDQIAHGDASERIRTHVLRLEQDIRALAARGINDRFSELWDRAAAPLMADDALMADSLSRARINLNIDGEVADCNADLPFRFFGHAWNITQKRRSENFGRTIDRLLLNLTNILKADFTNSNAGKSAENLQAAFGNGPLDRFDFAAMSLLLTKSSIHESISARRRNRLQGLIDTLQSQQFFPLPTSEEAYTFSFDSCRGALDAYRERLPKVIELARAVAIAELEIRGEYNQAKHGALFESFGENGLDASELALFPDYLVRLKASALTGDEQETLNAILAVDLPVKIVIQIDDVIEESPLDHGYLAFALRSRQLASMAMGMSGVFVLQSPASNLYSLHARIQRGFDYSGPAVFSIFSGATASAQELPPYLIAAAALESRVFPAFTFDPSAGTDWASRFSLENNPQCELDWPVREFAYADEKLQTISQRIPFTLIDFVACDTRYGKHFARLPNSGQNGTMISIEACVDRETRGALDSTPSLLLIDPEDRLHRVIVDEKLMREARRCRSMWRSLQELGGIHNSHALRLLAQERKSREDAGRSAPAEIAPSAVSSVQTLNVPVAVAHAAAEDVEKSPDEAYIETSRCSSCNECMQINNSMFAYDGNKQAYIADINAGSYAQLVEAAEGCQVSIIHPGKPRNTEEPGLDELLRRAESFM